LHYNPALEQSVNHAFRHLISPSQSPLSPIEGTRSPGVSLGDRASKRLKAEPPIQQQQQQQQQQSAAASGSAVSGASAGGDQSMNTARSNGLSQQQQQQPGMSRTPPMEDAAGAVDPLADHHRRMYAGGVGSIGSGSRSTGAGSGGSYR